MLKSQTWKNITYFDNTREGIIKHLGNCRIIERLTYIADKF